MGGPQQLYHLDAYIPLRISCDESKAAFHQKRKVPGRLGVVGNQGHSGTWTPGSEGGGAGGLDPWV